MKKYHILYNWPIEEISRLADSPIAETYSAGLTGAPSATFTSITEDMRGFGADLARARADRVHFAKWDELRKLLEDFEQGFSTFPDLSPQKFRLSVLLADKLSQIGLPLDEADINENLFEIRELPESLPISWFSRENRASFSDSVAAFSISDLSALEQAIDRSNISPEFMFHFLSALHLLDQLPPGTSALVKKSAPQIEILAADAFVRLSILTTGDVIHSTRRYLQPPTVLDPDIIRAGVAFDQWGDVLNVLSEYNSRDEILTKYLTIYHVIENFMFKFPIVDLERRHGGRMFSIRDFKDMYNRIKMTEGDALRKLFVEVFTLNATAAATFAEHITNRWSSMSGTLAAADIDQSLARIGVSFTFADFAVANAGARFAELVYKIRNAIAHNKETEFHLTYASMDGTMATIIEFFLIPSLEELSFSLISSVNTQLWYSNKNLLLY